MTTQELRHLIDVAWGRPVSEAFIEELREANSGVFTMAVYDEQGRLKYDPEETHNLVVNDGLAYLLGVGLWSTTDIGTWYLSMYNATHTPANADTMTTIAAKEITTTDVTETVRENWSPTGIGGTTTASTTVAAVQYECNTTGFTAYGAFICGGASSAFGNTGNTLYSLSNFAASRTLADTDTIDVTYTATLTAA